MINKLLDSEVAEVVAEIKKHDSQFSPDRLAEELERVYLKDFFSFLLSYDLFRLRHCTSELVCCVLGDSLS